MASLSYRTILLLAYTLLFAATNALVVPPGGKVEKPIIKRDGKSLKLDFDIRRGSGHTQISSIENSKAAIIIDKDNEKRDDATLTIQNAQTFYLADIYLGSNKQHVEVLVDTGSSDLWVVAKGATCEDGAACTSYGTYDKSSSSTFKSLGTTFQIEYVDGTTSTGTWSKETLTFGSESVTGLQFGDVSTTSSDIGVLGISVEAQESTNNEYPNLPVLLKNQGIIDKNAYSLYLNSADAASGSVLFGAIDNAKYSGSLVSLPQSSSGSLSVKLNSITYNSKTTSVSTSVVLDSGTTLTYLPSSIVSALGKAVGGTYSSSGGYYQISCDQPSNKYFTYNFNGVSIQVPLSDLAISLTYSDGTASGSCALGVLPSSDYYILGDNFLRSAYVYYDLDDATISIAQVKYTTAEDIQTV